MELPEQLTLLAELSSVEQKLKAALAHAENLPAEARKADEAAQQKRANATELDRRRHDAELARRSMESDLAAEKDKLRKWESRAEQIRGEREHAALLSEIGAQRRTISRTENDILEKMQELEDIGTELETATSAATEAEGAAAAEWKKVEDEVKAAKAEADVHAKARDALLEKLPKPAVQRYQRIAERRGTAIAIIRGETCTSCNRTLPPQMVLQIYKGELFETCPQCQRILVHEASTRAPDATAESDGPDGASAPA